MQFYVIIFIRGREMAKSKILKELVNEEISLNIALKRLIVLAADMNDNDLKEWAEKEINGYNTDDEVPEYRKICSHSFYYNGFTSNLQVTNVPLDIRYLNEDTLKMIEYHELREPLLSLEKYVKEFKDGFNLDLTMLAPEVLKNSGRRLQCISIYQKFNVSQIEKVLQTLSSKIMIIFIKLDKEFGCLDNLDIGCEKQQKKKLNETKQVIQQIIFGDKAKIKGDIICSDNVKIDKRKTKTTTKNSNTGKGNYSSEKHTDVKTEVNINNNNKTVKKNPWWKRLFNKKEKS